MDRDQWIEGAFGAAFSRAVAGLISRGMLSRLMLVPITEAEDNARVMRLADGMFLDYGGPRSNTRFVRRV